MLSLNGLSKQFCFEQLSFFYIIICNSNFVIIIARAHEAIPTNIVFVAHPNQALPVSWNRIITEATDVCNNKYIFFC